METARVIVLDTSVVSILFRGDERKHFYLPHITSKRTVLSFQTVEEVWFGAFKAKWGARRKNELSFHLQQYQVIWPDQEMVEICASLRARREGTGRSLTTSDAWIAATALRLSCPLASDDGDFDGIRHLSLIQASRTS